MLEDIRGDSYVECSKTEGELDPVGTAVRSPASALRNPNRKRVRLYADHRAEGFISLRVPAGAAAVVENTKGASLMIRDFSEEIQEQALAASEPPMAQLH
jgi:hypothetical protein